jgi:DNA-binding PadR family transcriptional regulator
MSRKHRQDFWRAWAEEMDEANVDLPPSGRGRGRGRGKQRRLAAEAWRGHFQEYMGVWPEEHWLFGSRRYMPWHKGRGRFNPFLANLLSKSGGLLPLLVLQLLAEEPRYGNELMSLIRERTGGQWVANPGAIYPLLTELEEEGLIDGQWDDPVKRTTRVYDLTPQGREELARITAVIRPKLEETITVLGDLVAQLDAPDA